MTIKASPTLEVPASTTTIPEAAAELQRLFAELWKQARVYTSGYVQSLLEGEEDIDWKYGWGIFRNAKYPLVESLLRDGETLKIGCGQNMWRELLYKFYMTEVEGGLVVGERKQGYDVGQNYLVTTGRQILEAPLVGAGEPITSFDSNGNCRPSTTIGNLDTDNRQRLIEPTKRLIKLLTDIAEFEKGREK